MIDATPSTDSDTEIQRGDKMRIAPWLLDGQADPADITLTVEGIGPTQTYTGSDLTEKRVTINGEIFYRYFVEAALPSIITEIEWVLNDPNNSVRDSAIIYAQPQP